MLIAQNPRIKELSVIDVKQAMVPAAGVAADLSHVTDLDFESACKVTGYAIDTAVIPWPNHLSLSHSAGASKGSA